MTCVAGRGRHVLLVPWFAQGHFSPVVQLAEVLAEAGLVTTLVFSARVHRRLCGGGPNDVNILRMEVIEDGLPEDPSHTPSPDELWASNRVMQAELEKLLVAARLNNPPPTCLISSTFCSWTRAVAQKLGIPRVELWSSLATMYCAGFFYHRLLEQGLLPFKGLRDETWITCIPGLPRILASDFPETLLPESQQGLDRVLQRVRETYAQAVESDRVLVNSIYELESEAFDALQASKVRAYAIGPLFLRTLSNTTPLQYTASRPSMYEEDLTCLQWLDSKDTASTLYVAFGTESKLPKDDIQELALGLEASEHNFLWVIRPGSVLGESSLSDILPDGFQERTHQRGQVVSWVPQPSVLAHRAIAGFLSHCGWNSTMESMWLGVPIIAWPQRVDQGINKKEHWKVGIALEKDEEGRVKRAAVERAVRALLQGKEGLRARKIAEEMKEVMLNATQRGGSSRMNLEMFIHDVFQASADTNVL